MGKNFTAILADMQMTRVPGVRIDIGGQIPTSTSQITDKYWLSP
jgi:hypothetical protein